MPAAEICELEFCCVGLLPKDFSLIFSTVTLRCVLMHVVYVVVYRGLASGSECMVEETSNITREQIVFRRKDNELLSARARVVSVRMGS